MKKVFIISVFILIIVFAFLIFSTHTNMEQVSSLNKNLADYQLVYPGILPDNKLYKLKVLRNKIIEKMIYDPVKKVEFDLLMADKTIYASKLLLEKGETILAKDTALKGENYYSILVQDYNKALLQGKKIPPLLDKKITLAAQKHQEIFKELEKKVTGEDKKAFAAAHNFSKINYEFIIGLRSPKK